MSGREFLQSLRAANTLRAPDFGTGTIDAGWNVAERGNELAGETGELCNVLKKMLRLQSKGQPVSEDLMRAAAEELGDVIICADLIAAKLGLDLQQAVRGKFNMTSRKIGSEVTL